jgi:hypothetical protein
MIMYNLLTFRSYIHTEVDDKKPFVNRSMTSYKKILSVERDAAQATTTASAWEKIYADR